MLDVTCVMCGEGFKTTDIFAMGIKEVYCPHCDARFWIKRGDQDGD